MTSTGSMDQTGIHGTHLQMPSITGRLEPSAQKDKPGYTNIFKLVSIASEPHPFNLCLSYGRSLEPSTLVWEPIAGTKPQDTMVP